MDLADDIAYSTYDLEDSLKAGFLNPFDIIFSKPRIYDSISKAVTKKFGNKFTARNVEDVLIDIFRDAIKPVVTTVRINSRDFENYFILNMGVAYDTIKELSSNGFLRTEFTSMMVGNYIGKINFRLNNQLPALSRVELDEQAAIQVEVLKRFSYESQILSPKLRIVEYRGREIVRTIFDTLANEEERGFELLPSDFRELYESVNQINRKRVICDYVAGMTDSYAIEFYGRLKSENPETIFKPF